MVVYYDENEESAVDIVPEAVELGHFAEEESYTERELEGVRALIEDAIPLLDRATFEFAQAVYAALLTVEDHPSFADPKFAEYLRLRDLETYVSFHRSYYQKFRCFPLFLFCHRLKGMKEKHCIVKPYLPTPSLDTRR